MKQKVQLTHAPSRTLNTWFIKSQIAEQKNQLQGTGELAPNVPSNSCNLILRIHETRMSYLQNRLEQSSGEEYFNASEDYTKYLMDCAPLCIRFLDAKTANERRSISIEYLRAINDYNAVEKLQREWPVEPEPLVKTSPSSSVVNNAGTVIQLPKIVISKIDPTQDNHHPTLKSIIPQSNKSQYEKIWFCTRCNDNISDIIEDVASNEIICCRCGLVLCRYMKAENETISETSEGNIQPRTSKYTYNRLSHYRDRLLQWIGSEYKGDLDSTVIQKLLVQMKIEKIKSVEGWTKKRMVSLLKRANLNEYYEHANWFIAELSGKPVPHRLDEETFQTLIEMFQAFEKVYEKRKSMLTDNRHPSRKNILTLSYLLRKFFDILGMHEEAETFPLLKNIEKVSHYERVFEKCCEDLGWQVSTIAFQSLIYFTFNSNSYFFFKFHSSFHLFEIWILSRTVSFD